MFCRQLTVTLTAPLLALAMVGCATDGGSAQTSSASGSSSATKSSEHPEFSGFLGDYSKLKPYPGEENVLEWVNPEISGTGHKAIIIDQVVTHLDPDLLESGVKPDPDVMHQITTYFHEALVREFGKYFTVTDKAGEGVMRYRAAITGVNAERDLGDTPLDFVPVVFVARTATGANSVKAHVFMESIYTDSVTGQTLAELVQSATGAASGEEISLDAVKPALDGWAKRAAQRTKAEVDKRAAAKS